MPYTINGIGTWYYGKRNRTRETATCEFCDRLTQVDSYETREFFVVLFIPIIPLRKFQIVRACSSCNKHRRMKLAEWQAYRDGALGSVKAEVEGQPSNLDLQEKLGWAQLGFALGPDARETFARICESHPERAIASYGLARSLEAVGKRHDAVAAYQRALERKPDLAEAARACADLLALMKRRAEALRVVQDAHQHSPTDPGLLGRIADLAMEVKDWGAAAQAYDQLFSLLPQLRQNKHLLKASAKAHKKAGIPEALA
jgi:tetratricopeptide (TPR) repeat protein